MSTMATARLLFVAVIGWGAAIGAAIDQDSPTHAEATGLRGTLVRVEGKTLIVSAIQPESDTPVRTVVTNAQTQVWIDGKLGKLADLLAEMPVVVASLRGDENERDRLMVVAITRDVDGIVAKIEGNKVIVEGRRPGQPAEYVSLTTDEHTQFLVDGNAGAMEHLKPRMLVTITSLSRSDEKPNGLMVIAISKGISGKVVKVEGSNLTLREKPGEIAITTDEHTRFVFPGVPFGRLDELKAETRITIRSMPARADRPAHLVVTASGNRD